MRIPYGFKLTALGTLKIKETEAETVRMIFAYYLAGASLGKVVDMLFKKHIPSPTGKAKWTRAAVDHLLSNPKYIAIVGLESYMSVQFKKSDRRNIDYGKAGTPRKETCYVSPVIIQMRPIFQFSTISATIKPRGGLCGRRKEKATPGSRFGWYRQLTRRPHSKRYDYL